MDIPDLLIDILTAPYDAWNWLADELFLAMNALFLKYGLSIVFFAALTEATIGLGVIFPGVIVMFLAGAYSQEQDTSFTLALLLAVMGTIIGDTVSYGLGRWGSGWLSHRFRLSLRMGEVMVAGHARWLIPFYHLHSVTRALGPVASGALRLPLRVWVPLDYLGAVIANVIWVGAGAVVGSATLTEQGTLEQHPALRLGVLALATVWVLVAQRSVMQRWRQIRAEDVAGTIDGSGGTGTATG